MSTRVVGAVIALSVLGFAMARGAGRAPAVGDVARIVRLSDLHFSPDGKSLVFLETRANLDSDEYESEIELIAVSGGAPRPLTRARHHAASPRWSPSGDRLGFLAPDAGKVMQLYVMPMAGGDALQLTSGKDGVDQFAWSPDGASIAYAMADPKPELKGEDKFRTAFKVGNDDVTIHEAVRPVHVWLVPAQGGAPRRLTSGTWSLPSSLPPGPPSSPIDWSRDGKSIVFVRQETPSTGDQLLSRVQVLDVASGQIRSLTGADGLEGYPVVSPDGSSIAYWRDRDARPWNVQDVWLAGFAGGAGRDISAALDKNVYLTRWSPNGDWLLVGANVDTTVGLWRLRLDGSSTAVPLGGVMPVNSYWIYADIDARGDIAFVGQSKTDPYEIYVVPADGGAPAALTQVNAGLADLALARSETVTWAGPGGRTLDGVVTYPAHYQQGHRYPLVLFIHGGPNSSSRERFNLVPQLLASHDWLVFEPNYRGSDNQGNAFFASIYRDAGQGPGEDVMSGIDYLKYRGLIDPTHMAVTGWSYGGFMTTWLAGHYPVWKAAVAGAPVTDWVEMYDLSDGNVTTSAQTGASPYVGEGMAINRRQSPSSAATRITAPTLILCDTGDFRVPIAQSFGLYRALVDNHVKTEFYAIPVDGHFPGDPIRQMDVYQRWQDWLVPYLR
ncbi:MAG TPA: S9 family peptidase [Steroidobacteraceae bacterium]|nr:S9 family peptidase [Steroidobacteraceae bacterium]